MLSQKEYENGNNHDRRDAIIEYLDSVKEKLMAGEAGDVLIGYSEFFRDKKPQSVVAFFGDTTGSTDPIRPTVLKVLNQFSSVSVNETKDLIPE